MSVTIYRSSDTNAPPISGAAGSLTDVLRACLVNGYGSVFAGGTITSNGTNVSDGDTVTIGSITYRFKTAIAAINDVLIGASAAASLTNLVAAINLYGTSGTTYFAGTNTNPDVWASAVTATVVTLKARIGGTGGNSIGLARSAATLTVSGANFTGGSGSNTKAGLGWTNPFNGNGGQAVFRAGAGVQQYWHIDDDSPNTSALGKEAQIRGSEAATGFQTGTNFFPTVAQIALGAGLTLRKSATSDNVARTWMVIADERTAFVFILSGDVAGMYCSMMFGEFYSIMSTNDAYRSLLIARTQVNTAGSLATEILSSVTNNASSQFSSHYVPRSYTTLGGSLTVCKWGDYARSCANNPMGAPGAGTTVPNGPDGDLHISPVNISEKIGFTCAVRGRVRGFFESCWDTTSTIDGDTVTGSGAYAGRTFMVVKNVPSASSGGLVLLDITGPWETN